ncbi:hypothetical protein C7B79_11445 [Chroococcidiopsis cubana CCALA 043]|nr:hypothetical protein C7B79_11445 [Chroococcidiopsis cubana CCALA 043]
MKASTCSRVVAESSMAQILIRWRLNEVMARYGIRAKELAAEMDISPSAISNLRKRSMPRLTEETLNNLCKALNKLSHERTLITPGELIEYIPEPENPNSKLVNDDEPQVNTAQAKLKQNSNSIDFTASGKCQDTFFLLSIVSELPDSA